MGVQKTMTDLYAIVRIRGSVNAVRGMDNTLEMLKLKKVNNCMIYTKEPSIQGMLMKARTYLTWGEVKQETLIKLLTKRGRSQGDKILEEEKVKEIAEKFTKHEKNTIDIKELKLPFRLSPPSKGYSSVRKPYPDGDAGYRGEKINELLEKMI